MSKNNKTKLRPFVLNIEDKKIDPKRKYKSRNDIYINFLWLKDIDENLVEKLRLK